MHDSLGHGDFGERKAQESAIEFERKLKSSEFFFIDLLQVDEIFQYYLDTDELSKAQALVHFAQQSHPYSSDLFFKLARVQGEQGDFHLALESIDDALHYSPGDEQVLVYKAEVLAQADRFSEAIQLLEKLLHTSEYPEEILLHMGNVAQLCGRMGQSERYYRQAIKQEPAFLEALYELLYLLEIDGRLEDCVTLCNDFLDERPFMEGIWCHLGLLYRKIGNYEKALEAFEYALAIREDYHYAWYQKGMILQDLVRPELSLQAFLQAGSHLKNDVPTLYHTALCFEQLEDYHDAIRFYFKVTRIDKEHIDSWLGLGFCLEKQDKYTQAIQYYEKALKLDDQNPELAFSLALCEYKLGHRYRAFQHLEQCFKLAPGESIYWQDWAQLLFDNENPDGAITYLEEAIRYYPKKPELYYQLASYMLDTGMREKGLQILENALLIGFDRHYFLFHLAPVLRYDPDVVRVIAQYS